MSFDWSSPSPFYSTFFASLRSVGTAFSMAMVGVYLHQRGFIDSPGKRTLALLSQQVTFPLFLFTRMLHCKQEGSTGGCPDVTEVLASGWILLLWPLYVVGAGLIVGRITSRLSNTPPSQQKSAWAAVAFGNSTGLPITLLTVVHANFPTTPGLAMADPTLFLSVYLLLYPVLQWGVGGWLLTSEASPTETSRLPSAVAESDRQEEELDVEIPMGHLRRGSSGDVVRRKIFNFLQTTDGLETYPLSNAESLYTGQPETLDQKAASEPSGTQTHSSESSAGIESCESNLPQTLFDKEEKVRASVSSRSDSQHFVESSNFTHGKADHQGTISSLIRKISERCFQPPVMGALLGIMVALIHPLRGIFVSVVDRDSTAPLGWAFDGLYTIGQAAIPLNMIILGCSLSNSYNHYTQEGHRKSIDGQFSKNTLISIIVGKMILMPIIGIVSVVLLRNFVLDIPRELGGSLYLVMMIVFLTPTANNVMLMVELSGANTKEGIASVIALQYLVAPVILTLSMSVAVGIAS